MKGPLDAVGNQWWRIAGAGSILAVIAVVVGFIIQGEPPDLSATDQEIAAWFTENSTAYRAGDYVIVLGFVLGFLPFISGLYGLLSSAEGASRFFSRLALFGGILLFAMLAIAGTFWGALAAGLAEHGDASAVRAAMYMDWYAFTVVPPVLGILFLATGIVLVRTGVLWPWLGYFSIVLGVFALIGGVYAIGDPLEEEEGIFGILGFIVFIGWGLWHVLMGVAMLLRKSAAVSAEV